MNPSERNKTLVSFLTKHGAKKIGLFGSVARGEERPDSDIDEIGRASCRERV